METKICTECHEEKPLGEFYRDRTKKKDGHKTQCKNCFCEQGKKLYWANPEKYRKRRREEQRKYRAKNPEKHKELNRQKSIKYRMKNRIKANMRTRFSKYKSRGVTNFLQFSLQIQSILNGI